MDFSRLVRHVGGMALCAGATLGCSDKVEEPESASVGPSSLLPKGQPPPEIITDRSGTQYRLVGRAQFRTVNPGDLANANLKGHTSVPLPEKLSVQSLVELHRARTVFGEYEYVSEPDIEAAERLYRRLTEPESEQDREGRDCCGNDDRVLERSNLDARYKPTAFTEVGCSGVMISPSVLLTAAHCVNWFGTWTLVTPEPSYGGSSRWPRWVHAMDGLDSDAAPITHTYAAYSYDVTYNGSYTTTSPGAYLQCYSPKIHANWPNGGSQYDFAIVDFGACGYSPGSLTGYWSPLVRTEAQIEASTAYMVGYPGRAEPGQPMNSTLTWRYEELWGLVNQASPFYEAQMFRDSGTPYIESQDTWLLRYSTIDTSGGNSGSGLYQIVNSQRRLIGNHFAVSSDDTYNKGRRWDATTKSFAEDFTSFPN